jgi:hypothetical protein
LRKAEIIISKVSRSQLTYITFSKISKMPSI